MSNWYKKFDDNKAESLAYQTIKYQNRHGWSHKDLIRLSHLNPGELDNQVVRNYIKWVARDEANGQLPELYFAWEAIRQANEVNDVVRIINEYKLTWEFVPGQWQGERKVWEALLPNLPYTALMRNLGRLSSLSIITQSDTDTLKVVGDKLTNSTVIRKARVHPMSIITAAKTYGNGHGQRGSLTWEPVTYVMEALSDAFYDSFNYVEPSGKRFFIGIDASGSMSWDEAGVLTAAEAAVVVAMTILRTEPFCETEAFNTGPLGLNLTKHDSLPDCLDKMMKIMCGGTDLAAPMHYALDKNMQIDTFVVLTDNETWAGRKHPIEALGRYRREANRPDARLAVAAFTSTGFSIADPKDPLNLDLVGMDTNIPSIITRFAKGDI
jgi:60 kDa SS-A/Ro ribonucleoprotein